MLQYSDIAHLVTDNTPAEIAAILQANTQHKRDVMAVDFDPKKTDLCDVLERYDLLDGSLEAVVTGQNNAQLTAAWEKLKRHMQTVNRVIYCHEKPEIGSLTTLITNLAKVAKPDKATEIQTAMDELTGGRLFAGVTTADVEACIAAETARVTQETLEAEWVALQNDGGINAAVATGDRAGLVTGLQAAVAAIGGA